MARYRSRLSRRRSRSKFKRTAKRTKAANILRRVTRGGIRL